MEHAAPWSGNQTVSCRSTAGPRRDALQHEMSWRLEVSELHQRREEDVCMLETSLSRIALLPPSIIQGARPSYATFTLCRGWRFFPATLRAALQRHWLSDTISSHCERALLRVRAGEEDLQWALEGSSFASDSPPRALEASLTWADSDFSRRCLMLTM